MKEKRNWSPKEKLEIVLEGIKSENGISEICRRRGVSTVQYYQWKEKLVRSAGEIYKHGRTGLMTKQKEGKLEEKLKTKDAIIAEITEENLKLKKKYGF
jgi:transposase